MALKFFSKSILGIDIGTSAIKIIELSKFANKVRLENYAEVPTFLFQQQEAQSREKSIIFLPSEEITQAIKVALEEAKIKTKTCVFSLPDFLTFFTTFSIPQMSKEEIDSAIKIEARKYIPVPIKEVYLDSYILGQTQSLPSPLLNILLIAVPNEIIYKYQKIALLSNLKILALEAEAIGLINALGKGVTETISIIDAGVKSTTCTIVENGVLKAYHSINLSTWTLTEKIAKEFQIDWQLAEKIKKIWGLSTIATTLNSEEKKVYESIFSLALNPFLEEINKIFRNFYLKEKKGIDKIILAGGLALIPGVLKSFENYFKTQIEIADPFSVLNISYPPELKENIKKLAPSFSVAIGTALKYL